MWKFENPPVATHFTPKDLEILCCLASAHSLSPFAKSEAGVAAWRRCSLQDTRAEEMVILW